MAETATATALPTANDPTHESVPENHDDIVMHIRINYKSGAYMQTWFSKFDIVEQGAKVVYDWEVPEIAAASKHTLAYPLQLNAADIESVWVMSTCTALELYNKSMEI